MVVICGAVCTTIVIPLVPSKGRSSFGPSCTKQKGLVSVAYAFLAQRRYFVSSCTSTEC